MPRDHSLRKNGYAEDLDGIPRAKQHAHCEPRSRISVKCSKDDEQCYLEPDAVKKFLHCLINESYGGHVRPPGKAKLKDLKSLRLETKVRKFLEPVVGHAVVLVFFVG